jgi:putative ABC transport system permease protein
VPRDLRFAIRRLLHTPAFTAAAVACLALGIGANTAIFSVIRAVLLKPLPYEAPDRLVAVWEANSFRKSDRNTVSPANFLDWRSASQGFSGMAAVYGGEANLSGAARPEAVSVQGATANLFEVLGVPAAIGRTFGPADDTPGAPDVALLSHGLWQRRYSADSSIVGRTIQLDGAPVTVIGVMPPWTESVGREPRPGLWVPMRLDPAEDYRETSGRFLQVVGRLAPGVTRERAQADLAMIATRLEAEHPAFNTGWSVNVVPLTEQVVGAVRGPLALLGGVVLLVLLIACGNVANLMLAQATARRREMAVHAALGASAVALGRRLLAESVLVAVTGGALGVLLASWCVDGLSALPVSGVPRLQDVRIDGFVLAFTLVVSLVVGIGFGLVPAFHAARGDLHEDLKEGGRSSSRRGGRIRTFLVGAQVAGSLVLLVSAGLLLKSFARVSEVDLGFNPDHLLTARVSLGGERYKDEARQARFFVDLLAGVRAIPGVQSASAINWLPLSGLRSATRMVIEGDAPVPPGQEPGGNVSAVDPHYFDAMQIPILRGRPLAESDRPGVPLAVVVSRSFATRYLGGGDPIGRRIHMEWGDTLVGTVVGVARDIKHTGVDSAASPTVYWAMAQFPWSNMTLVVRTQDDPSRMGEALVAQVRRLDPEQPVADLKTFDEWLGGAVARRRFMLVLLGGFAALGLVLTAVGLYGTTAYGVVQRTRELGIRAALGASRRDLLWSVLRQALVVVAVGIAAGLAGALVASRLLSSLLFEVSATDPVVFVAIALLLLVVSTLAGFLPARRATRADPMIAIRAE